jgi:hypothetical protein
MAAGTDQGVAEGAAAQLRPSDAQMLGDCSGSSGLWSVSLVATVAAQRSR